MRSAYRWLGALVLVLGVGVLILGLVGMVGNGLTVGRADPAPATSGDGELARVVGVTDGDTLRVSVDGVTERLRIIGIDAPELRADECLAQESASLMQRLTQSQSVRISADDTQADRDVYGRILRHVRLSDGRNVALEMLTAGLATEYTYAAAYADVEDYRAAQEAARAAGRGVWAEVCDGWVGTPATAPGSALADPPAGCEIKGNISSEGERIYHVPGQRSYTGTSIAPTKGERWFCTEQEARDAGWRRARP